MQWTVVNDSNYARFSLSTCQTNVLSTSAHNTDDNQHTSSAAPSNTTVSSNHTQIQYGSGPYTSGQMIALNPNLVNNYSASLSTPTSPQGDSNIVQSVYSQGPTPNQSPVQISGNNQQAQQQQLSDIHLTTTQQQSQQSQQQAQQQQQTQQKQTTTSTSTSTVAAAPQKRKRSVNPQSDENFQRALEAVRYGGIGFCKAARMYGCNNRTLWLEYKKRGYPISRPSIKNRIKLEPNMTPPPASPTPEENTSMENYEHNMTQSAQSTINMGTAPPSQTENPTSIMCPPAHAHPATMGVMSFLDTTRTANVSFEPSLHPATMRQRYPEGVNVHTTAINLQGINFNSM